MLYKKKNYDDVTSSRQLSLIKKGLCTSYLHYRIRDDLSIALSPTGSEIVLNGPGPKVRLTPNTADLYQDVVYLGIASTFFNFIAWLGKKLDSLVGWKGLAKFYPAPEEDPNPKFTSQRG